MSTQKQLVEEYFNQDEYWQGEVYRRSDEPFCRAVGRRRFYALDMLKKILPVEREDALDIGFGGGAYLPDLMELGYNVYGVEICEEMFRKAEALCNFDPRVHLELGDVEELPFEDEKFDLVLCIGVLGYLLSDYKALSEIRRVLKPGGLAIININNLWNLTDLDYILRRKIRSLWRGRGEDYLKPTQPHTLPSEWVLTRWEKPFRQKVYNLREFELLMRCFDFKLVDAMTFYFPLRLLRRIKILAACRVDSLENFLERFFRKHRIPVLSYLGSTYTGIFRKAGTMLYAVGVLSAVS